MTLHMTDVFTEGADGVHTYRIPALLAAPGGALLAFCEARKVSGSDASPTDLVMKRSLDRGATWGPLQVLVRGVDAEAIMNPCPVADGSAVFLFCMNAHKTEHGRHRHLWLRSDDDGLTWSTPEDVTDRVGDDTFIPGPGVSIRIASGRLVVPGYVNRYGADRVRTVSLSGCVYTDDQGRTWHGGQPVDYPMSNESQVVERADGALLLNFRIQVKENPPGCRGAALSRDGGATWSAPFLMTALNEQPCQAGFIRWRPAGESGPGRLLFSNPDTRPGDGLARTHMTVKVSADEGETWPVSRLVHSGRAAYSCPAPLADGSVGLLFECGENRTYARIRYVRLAAESLR